MNLSSPLCRVSAETDSFKPAMEHSHANEQSMDITDGIRHEVILRVLSVIYFRKGKT